MAMAVVVGVAAEFISGTQYRTGLIKFSPFSLKFINGITCKTGK